MADKFELNKLEGYIKIEAVNYYTFMVFVKYLIPLIISVCSISDLTKALIMFSSYSIGINLVKPITSQLKTNILKKIENELINSHSYIYYNIKKFKRYMKKEIIPDLKKNGTLTNASTL